MKEIPLYTLQQSIEADLKNKETEVSKTGNKGSSEKTLFDKIKELPSKVSNLNKRAQLFLNKRKNLGFYKRYLGRVESGLYSRYAGESMVTENKMIDDPVTILKGPARDYIRDIVKDLNRLYTNFDNVCKKLEGKTTSDECIAVIKPYATKILGKNVKGESVDKNDLSWEKRLVEATKLKIANILLRNGSRTVYGYTAESMALKKYPPPNHLIVTLFVENPEEKPVEQSVNDIFQSVESFKILANSDKNDVFNIQNMNRSVMEKTVDGKIINDIKGFRSSSVQRFKSAINNETSKDKVREEAKIIESIWDGMNKSSRILLNKKAYIIDCINTYFDMVIRIDKLAVNSIKEMLDIENKHKDPDYKTGLKYAKDKKENAAGINEEKRAKARELSGIANKLNKG